MQDAKKENVTAAAVDAQAKWVVLYLDGILYAAAGGWQWTLQTETVFCSDVMAGWPESFHGTKSILHPDDKKAVAAALQKLTTAEAADFRFRIITTYGEIKTLEGSGIRLAEPDEPLLFQPDTDLLAQSQKTETAQRTAQDLSQQKTVFSFAERLGRQGVWCVNQSTGKTWFSDGLFRLLGLPPQGINVHPNTLSSFIHPDDHKPVVQAFEQALDKAVPLHLQFRLQQAGGAELWVEQTTAWDFNERGETLLYGLLQDVSTAIEVERKCEEYEGELKLQKGLMQFAEAATGVGYWQVNVLTRKVTYSDSYLRLFGLKPGLQATGTNFLAHLVHPDDREVYQEVQSKMWKEHTAPEIDFRIVRPDGKMRYLRQKGKAFIAGNEIIVAGTVQDLTAQKTLEKKWSGVQQSLELKTATVLQAEKVAGIGSWVWNLQTGETQWSENFYEVLGQKPTSEAITQKALLRSIHADDQKLFSDAMALTVKEKLPGDFTFRLIRHGEVRHLKAAFRLLTHGATDYFMATVQDVTAEQQAIQNLTGRISLMEQLADAIPDQVVVTDAENNIRLWNAKAEQVYKVKKEKAVGQNFFDVLPALKKEPVLARLVKVIKGEEVRLHDEPGHYPLRGWFDMLHIPLYTDGSTVTGILHLLHDVTEQHHLHRQLTSRLGFIERLLEVSVDRVVALDRNMNYLYWNKKAEEDFGLKKKDVIGKNILEIFPATGPQLSYADFRRALYGETVYHPATEEAKEESYLIPVKDEKEDVTAVLWVQHDRSKDLLLKKQSQKALEIINALNENYLELDRRYRVLFINKKALDYFESSEEEIVGKVLWEVFPPLLDTPLHLALVHAMEERIVLRREFASSLYGTDLLVSIAPTVDGIAVAFSDIGFIKEAEQRLLEEHRRLTEAQALGHVGSFEWVVGSAQPQWSDELYRINGLEPGSRKAAGRNTHEYIHPDDREAFEKEKEASLQTAGRYRLVHRILPADGKLRWVNHQWESLADENGNVIRVRGVVQDITEQKKAGEQLLRLKDQLAQKATDRYHTLFNSIGQGFSIIQMLFNETGYPVDYRFLEVNPAFEKQTGLRNPVGKTIRELLPGIEEHWLRIYGEVALTGKPKHVEQRAQALDRWYEVHAFRMDAPEEHHVAVLFNDVTERKRREGQREFLLKLSDALRPLTDAAEIQETAARVLGEQLNATRAFYFTAERDEPSGSYTHVIASDDYHRPGMASTEGRYPQPVSGENMYADLLQGKNLVIPDVNKFAGLTQEYAERYRTWGIQSFIAVPLVKGGRYMAAFGVNDAAPRQWTADEIALVEETAERTWAAIERARAEEALRKIEEVHVAQLESRVEARTGELKDSRELLKAAMDGSLDFIQVLQAVRDGERKIVDFTWVLNNKRWENVYGDTVGKSLMQTSPAVAESGMLQRFIDVTESGIPQRDEVYYNDGKFRGWFDQSVVKLNDGVMLTTRDVTDRKRMEQSLKERAIFTETVIDASIDQITIFDRKERFVVWNKKAEEAGGLKREDVIGKTIAEVFPAIASEPEFVEAQQKAFAGEMVYIPAKRGLYSKNYQQWFYVPLKNETGEVYAVMNIIHDITDKVEAEEKLRQQNRELEAKNEEITNFAFIASHDLKEPIRKISTFSNWLMEREADGLSTKGKEYAFKINSAVKRLDGLIDDITTLTKLQAIKISPSEVALNAVLSEAAAELQEAIESSGAVIEGETLPTVTGDRKQLVHLFRNLIDNAVKFRQPGAVPVVEITCRKAKDVERLPHGEYYELRFSDNGIGFDTEYAEKIFRVFQRLHGQSQYPGSGIGLAICKKIMENHGGGIWAQSKPGKGSVFTCYFPVRHG